MFYYFELKPLPFGWLGLGFGNNSFLLLNEIQEMKEQAFISLQKTEYNTCFNFVNA